MPGLQPEDYPPMDHDRTAREIALLDNPDLLVSDPEAFEAMQLKISTLLRELADGAIGDVQS